MFVGGRWFFLENVVYWRMIVYVENVGVWWKTLVFGGDCGCWRIRMLEDKGVGECWCLLESDVWWKMLAEEQ